MTYTGQVDLGALNIFSVLCFQLVATSGLIACLSVVCCSVSQWCPTVCDPMDCSTPGFLVLHHLLELAQTHVN